MIRGSLYTKYRPKIFEDVYGQKYISEILKNQIKYKKFAHAYLFSGTRGTGKTTCARIFAKAINCEANKNGNPCYECNACNNKNNSILNIVELDAASNNSVDQMRNLIEELKYSNFVGGYKVYILDEVHMLSMSAFNALLKTLEEPPGNVVFILSTTELKKIPQTIVSRCQKFEFKNIDTKQIINRLLYITQSEGIDIDDESLEFIAYMGNGSMRDSISVLERILLYTEHIKIEDVRNILGVISNECIFDFLGFLLKKDSLNSIRSLSKIFDNDLDIKYFINKTRNILRDLMFIKINKTDYDLLLEKNQENILKMESLIKDIILDDIKIVVEEINAISNKVLINESEFRIYLEIFILKFSKLININDRTQNCNLNNHNIDNEEKKIKENTDYIRQEKNKIETSNVKRYNTEHWKQFLNYLKESKYMVIYSLLQYGVIQDFTEEKILFRCNSEGIHKRLIDMSVKKQIESNLKKFFNKSIVFTVYDGVKKIDNLDIEDKIKNFLGTNFEIENK